MISYEDLRAIPRNYQIPDEVDRKYCTVICVRKKSDEQEEQESRLFNLEEQKETISSRISEAVIYSVNLINVLKQFNSEEYPKTETESKKKLTKDEALEKFKKDEAQKRINEGEGLKNFERAQAIARTNRDEALKRFKKEQVRRDLTDSITLRAKNCKMVRAVILGYTEKITSEEWLGPLIFVNEMLVTALRMYKKIIQPEGAEFYLGDKQEDVTSSKDKQKEDPVACTQKRGDVKPSNLSKTEGQDVFQECAMTKLFQGDENNPFFNISDAPIIDTNYSVANSAFLNNNPFSEYNYPSYNNPFSRDYIRQRNREK
ncbi:putative vhs domain protein [Erysiphe necator]|uniref:Putative vhs domain protein n=1 Tax=Uncinula necator TaxID=52586 RepID=A0A0B1NYI8_UNCNE|nr:putative vhs domain protein [Erysiphe necator]